MSVRSQVFLLFAAAALLGSLATACGNDEPLTAPGTTAQDDAPAGDTGTTAPATVTLKAVLSGEAEVPGPGDGDGTGTAELEIDLGRKEICYELTVENVDSVTAAHIHAGQGGQAGDVVVTLVAPVDGSSDGCVPTEAGFEQLLAEAPEDYYINVHSEEYPDGAVRGQLALVP